MSRPMRPDDLELAFVGGGDPGALEACFAHVLGEAAPPSLPAASMGGEAALIEAYRARGWLEAKLDPLGLAQPAPVPELDLCQYGMDTGIAHALVERLRAAYCAP